MSLILTSINILKNLQYLKANQCAKVRSKGGQFIEAQIPAIFNQCYYEMNNLKTDANDLE